MLWFPDSFKEALLANPPQVADGYQLKREIKIKNKIIKVYEGWLHPEDFEEYGYNEPIELDPPEIERLNEILKTNKLYVMYSEDGYRTVFYANRPVKVYKIDYDGYIQHFNTCQELQFTLNCIKERILMCY